MKQTTIILAIFIRIVIMILPTSALADDMRGSLYEVENTRDGEFSSRINKADERIETSLRNRLSRLPADSLFKIGYRHTNCSPIRTDSALRYYGAAIMREDEFHGDSAAMASVVKCMINSAFIYINVFENFAETYKLLRTAEAICREYGMDSILAHVYLNLSDSFYIDEVVFDDILRQEGCQEEKESESYLKKAFTIAERTLNDEVLVFSLINMSNLWLGRKDSLLADYAKRFLESDIDDSHRSYGFAKSLSLGIIALDSCRFDEAAGWFKSMSGKTENIDEVGRRLDDYSKYLQGVVLEKKGDPRGALEIYRQIYEDSKTTDDSPTIVWMAYSLHAFFLRYGDNDNSDRYLLEYYKTRDRMRSSGLGKNLHELEMGLRLDDFGKELDAAREADRKHRIIILAGAIVCLSVILSLSIILVYTNKRKAYIMKLYEKNQQIASVAGDEQHPVNAGSCGMAEENEGNSREVAAAIPAESEDGEIKIGEKEQELERAVAGVLEDGSSIFDPDFQLASLCAAVGSNPTYVSRAVGRRYGKSFKTLLTEMRVREACRRFDDPGVSGAFTVEAICRDVGFKSRAAFSVAFKNITGLTPTEYRNAARKYSGPRKE